MNNASDRGMSAAGRSRGRSPDSGTDGSGTYRPGSPGPTAQSGLLKAMSPGVVDYLFRQLVAGSPAEDVQWGNEGVALAAQPPGAELARRLSDCDLEALTPIELFHYVRAAQRLASWAESLREDAVSRYCGTQPAGTDAASGECRPGTVSNP